MPKSKHRKNQKKKAKARTENLKAKQQAFIKQFQQKFNEQVSQEIETEAQKIKENEIDGTEERTLIDTTMSTPPTK